MALPSDVDFTPNAYVPPGLSLPVDVAGPMVPSTDSFNPGFIFPISNEIQTVTQVDSNYSLKFVSATYMVAFPREGRRVVTDEIHQSALVFGNASMSKSSVGVRDYVHMLSLSALNMHLSSEHGQREYGQSLDGAGVTNKWKWLGVVDNDTNTAAIRSGAQNIIAATTWISHQARIPDIWLWHRDVDLGSRLFLVLVRLPKRRVLQGIFEENRGIKRSMEPDFKEIKSYARLQDYIDRTYNDPQEAAMAALLLRGGSDEKTANETARRLDQLYSGHWAFIPYVSYDGCPPPISMYINPLWTGTYIEIGTVTRMYGNAHSHNAQKAVARRVVFADDLGDAARAAASLPYIDVQLRVM